MRKKTRQPKGSNANTRINRVFKRARLAAPVVPEDEDKAQSESGLETRASDSDSNTEENNLAQPKSDSEDESSAPAEDESSASDSDQGADSKTGSDEESEAEASVLQSDDAASQLEEDEAEDDAASLRSGSEEESEAEENECEGDDDELDTPAQDDVVLSEDENEGDERTQVLLSQVPETDREALRDMIERAVEATRKGANAALRKGLSRKDILKQLSYAFSRYYGYNEELADYFLGLFGPEECLQFFEACDAPRPVTLRCNTIKTRRRDLAQTLIARGVNIDVLGEWSKHGLVVTDASVPVGATPEYLAGHYMLQAASSFLPVLALQPKPDEVILDVAAAPGGKSSYIAQLMRNTGVVVANDANKTRCYALTANLHRLGCRNTLVTNFDGRKLLSHFNKRSFDRVLLDAPCSGSGVFSKDPGAKVKRTPDDFHRLQCLQKELLCQAIDLCKPTTSNSDSGYVVYSTCSVSVEENEGVIDYILKNRKVKLVDTGINFGVPGLIKYKSKRFNENIALTRRIYPHKHNMDGFFVAKLMKLAD